ncbi:riboflavin synthase [Henriciella aquimarina]|uniref:riboflavin synthase n=1 Tax=Henriciella aquimarina TaxID=545261 RepID=UPI000A02FB91|nr:riboflavin synthase [Henriciella aquimarina]
MFTGLVTDIGTIEAVEDRTGLRRFRVASAFPLETIAMGASIMHSGVCLTVVAMGEHDRGSWFEVEAVPETLGRTMLGALTQGSKVNLEQSLKLGDELGGHLVYGHVDALGEVISIVEEGESYRITIRPPASLRHYFAAKGSVAIDGVSLTVASVHDNGDFDIAIIPHTWQVTTLHELQPASKVNLEVDMLARYVARMIGADAPDTQVAE